MSSTGCVGRNVLQGKYVIEHDTDRMARGEPCTHIYAAGDLTKPIVTFHCTHLEAGPAEKDTVVLATLPNGMRKLLQFQFAGEGAAHGYPTGRNHDRCRTGTPGSGHQRLRARVPTVPLRELTRPKRRTD